MLKSNIYSICHLILKTKRFHINIKNFTFFLFTDLYKNRMFSDKKLPFTNREFGAGYTKAYFLWLYIN